MFLEDVGTHVILKPVKDTLFLRDDYEAEEEACKDCGKSSILVVDDNQELLFFLHTILSEEFRVITASNGKEGLEKAIKYLPNMIVSDVVMPEMTGIEMVKKLQANTYACHIPIVLLSSKADVENQNEGLELGYFYSLYCKFRLILYLLQIEYLIDDFQCMFGVPLYQGQVLLNDRAQIIL